MSIEKIFIPIGIDCGLAETLRNNNSRIFSLPFDWVVTYNGVTDIIANKFNGYLFPDKQFNISCHTKFVHNTFPNDYDMMNRRVNRFMELLNSENELIFIRKGHMIHHHKESDEYNCILKNDLQDCHDLHNFLKITYPKLKFKIICILCCEKCSQTNIPYTELPKFSIINNIEIYNITTNSTCNEKNVIFNNTIKNILMKLD